MSEVHDLEIIVRSRITLVTIDSAEEQRVIRLLTDLGKHIERPVYLWTITDGLRMAHPQGATEVIHISGADKFEPSDPKQMLYQIKESAKVGIFVLVDFHCYLDDPVTVRLLKEVLDGSTKMSRTMVLLGHDISLPKELNRFRAPFSLDIPSRQELMELIDREARMWSDASSHRVKSTREVLSRLVDSLYGLNLSDAQQMVRNSIYDDGAITEEDLTRVVRDKFDTLNRGGVLSLELDTARFAEVGGLERLERWVSLRAPVFDGKADAAVLDPPKGLLILGVQGCGKSLAARSVAGLFRVPLIRLEFSALYDKYFGESERNLREILKVVDAMAPCVLWADEIEKAIASDSTDGGTSRRVLGTFLTWMAERETPAFIVATANDIESLPPELVRKGRFDELFFVDLPTPKVRADIFGIHLQKRNQNLSYFDCKALAALTEGFSGAEIEQAIVSALYAAYGEERPLTQEYIELEIESTQPLSVVMAERIRSLRDWASQRTVPAD